MFEFLNKLWGILNVFTERPYFSTFVPYYNNKQHNIAHTQVEASYTTKGKDSFKNSNDYRIFSTNQNPPLIHLLFFEGR